jgi:glutathione S-transferase
MILIGMFDSPFVRRVAVTLNFFNMPFEHRNWSVGRDFDKIREFNPLGRVPTLVLDDGEALIESASILDFLDDSVGPTRALLPASGRTRRDALRLMAIATGAAEKGVLQLYEGVFRPEEKRHEPWLTRCRTQMHAALAELERAAQARAQPAGTSGAGAGAGAASWLVGDRMTQADITVACVFNFLNEALGAGNSDRYPTLGAQSRGFEALPAFQASKAPWFSPDRKN